MRQLCRIFYTRHNTQDGYGNNLAVNQVRYKKIGRLARYLLNTMKREIKHDNLDRKKGTVMKQKIKTAVLVSICVLIWGTPFTAAQDPPDTAVTDNALSEKFSLPIILKYAYHSNPSIQVSRETWQAVIETFRIGKSYPDPQVMVTYFPSPIETRLGPQDWNLNLSQTIPFPGKLSRKAKVLEADARISKLKMDRTVRQTLTDLSASYYELVYIQQALDIAKKNLDLNRELTRISENSYTEDKALFYDVSKARAQTAQIQYDILLLEELEQAEKAGINTILNREPNAALGRAEPLEDRTLAYTLDELYALSRENQEEIRIAGEQIIKAEESVKLSEYESLPTFKLGLFYAGIGEPDVPSPPKDAGDDAVGIQFGFSIPIWFGKNKSSVSRAIAQKNRAAAQKQQVTNTTREKISRLFFKLQNAGRLITLYEENLLPQSVRSLHTAETWYREGQTSFADLLEVQATVYNFQLSLARARADYGKTFVMLEKLAGMTLDKRTEDPDGGSRS